jgi:hypothetical protein
MGHGAGRARLDKLTNPNYWRRDAKIEAIQRSAERHAHVRIAS